MNKHFLLLYFALKQKMEKGPIFLIKPWFNPFGKVQTLGPVLYRCFLKSN